jgi:ubiquinone/menaquinone biosynthesis C-methylase UbiE
VQSAESTTFIDESFDAVCVAQALHWFDYELFWPEVQRVLKPSGVFAAWQLFPIWAKLIGQVYSPGHFLPR